MTVSLEDVLASDELTASFLDFTRKELSEKNLLFYCAVHKFQTLLDDGQDSAACKSQAEKICKRFIAQGSQYEVTIEQHQREEVLAQLRKAEVERDAFKPALDVAYKSLIGDQYPRFRDSPALAVALTRGAWSLCAVKLCRTQQGVELAPAVLLGVLEPNVAPPPSCAWHIDGLSESAACAVFDNGLDGPQLLLMMHEMIGSRVSRLLHGWEVTPKNLGMYASGTKAIRWELSPRGSFQELSEVVQEACIRLTADPTKHQPQIKPKWRDSVDRGLMTAPKVKSKCVIL